MDLHATRLWYLSQQSGKSVFTFTLNERHDIYIFFNLHDPVNTAALIALPRRLKIKT